MFKFSQFKIAFSDSTRCLWVFIVPAGGYTMLLQYADMYEKNGHSNTKYNMKYNYVCLDSLRDTLQIFKSKP